MQRHGVGCEALAHFAQHALKVGAGAVELVDEDEARQVLAVSMHPHRLRLRLDAAHAAHHDHRAVNDANRAHDLGGKVNVAGRVNQVDAIAAPITGGSGGGDGDAARPLLLHPVQLCGAIVHTAGAVNAPCVIQDRLRRGRLARVYVGVDADDADEPDVPIRYIRGVLDVRLSLVVHSSCLHHHRVACFVLRR